MLSFEDTDDKQMPPCEDGSFLQGLGFAGNNITENNSFLNIVTGADRCIAESRVQGVVNTLNYHVDCSDNRASDWSKQHEGSTSAECTSFLHILLVSYTTMEQRIRSVNHSLLALRLIRVKQELVLYNNGAKDQKCQSLSTCFETNPSETRACVGNTCENTTERRLLRSCQLNEKSCDEDMADGEEEGRTNGVNSSSVEADCASSSQPFGLIRDRSHLLLDLHTNENVLIKGEANRTKISYGEYASELFIAIQMADNLQLLDG